MLNVRRRGSCGEKGLFGEESMIRYIFGVDGKVLNAFCRLNIILK